MVIIIGAGPVMSPGRVGSPLSPNVLPPPTRHSQKDFSKRIRYFGRVGHRQRNDRQVRIPSFHEGWEVT